MYRVIQFYRAVSAHIHPHELEAIAPLLGDRGMALFRKLSRPDQRHGLNVYLSLRQQGHHDPTLLTAALLHDIGKTAGKLSLIHRIAVVLMRAFSPRLLEYVETNGRGRFLSPFRLARHHAELGAALVAEAGFSPLTVELIRRHHEEPTVSDVEDPLAEWVAALRWADGMN